MKSCEEIYARCRYIPDRKLLDREFSGIIYLSDFDTTNPLIPMVSKISECLKFCKAIRFATINKYSSKKIVNAKLYTKGGYDYVEV